MTQPIGNSAPSQHGVFVIAFMSYRYNRRTRINATYFQTIGSSKKTVPGRIFKSISAYIFNIKITNLKHCDGRAKR